MAGILKTLRLEHGGISVQGTPRRLAVMVADLSPRQPDTSERLRGPPCKVSIANSNAPGCEGLGCKETGHRGVCLLSQLPYVSASHHNSNLTRNKKHHSDQVRIYPWPAESPERAADMATRAPESCFLHSPGSLFETLYMMNVSRCSCQPRLWQVDIWPRLFAYRDSQTWRTHVWLLPLLWCAGCLSIQIRIWPERICHICLPCESGASRMQGGTVLAIGSCWS